MDDCSAECIPSFAFPFTPYDVQVDFMRALYKTLQESKIGIFESPTGTGKSMSLICGSLTWLKNFQENKKKDLEQQLTLEPSEENGDDDWFASYSKEKELSDKSRNLKMELDFLKMHEKRIEDLKAKKKGTKRKRMEYENDQEFDELFAHTKNIKQSVEQELMNAFNVDPETFVLDDYNSDDDIIQEETKSQNEQNIMKIFYCSRTHSQISQFVCEIKRSPFCSNIRVTSLGSRLNLCINEDVQKLKHLGLINEKCLDMQQNKRNKKSQILDNNSDKKRKSKGKCPFYVHSNMLELRDNILIEVMDIEQTIDLGKNLRACPYYSERYSIPEAELVVLPYNILLHKATRKAWGINLKDNIVVIDEAHNLVETINNIHSSEISGPCLFQTYLQLRQYQQRYYSRLSAKNLMYIKQILYIMSAFINHLGGSTDRTITEKCNSSEIKVLMLIDFLSEVKVDNINLFKILKYCEQSKISQKLQGFVGTNHVSITKRKKETHSLIGYLKTISDLNSQESAPGDLCSETDVVQTDCCSFVKFQEFLSALTNPSKNGRILSCKQETLSKSCLKFLLLNPALEFQEIIHESRSIVLAGGTMEPISEFINQLFLPSGINASQIEHFSCGHVIPSNHLLAVALSHGSSGKLLDFSYKNRNHEELMNELGTVLNNLCMIVPGGIVCFFPSYNYAHQIYNYWKKKGIIEKLSVKKKIFQEPERSNQIDNILNEYARTISSSKGGQQNGALLFSIVGGKMSEGINFSDDLGRCIIMVGLPYANIESPELKEKMNYLNANVPHEKSEKLPGQIYYENICMKAVNQSIGRAIRHKNDYSTIVLLDSRYHRANIVNALPSWISSHLKIFSKFGPAFLSIRKFFAEKKNNS